MTTMTAPSPIDAAAFALLNDWQRGFPLVPRPFAHVGRKTGQSESEVIQGYRQLIGRGLAGRVGPVFAPRRLGASALAALSVPVARLESVARLISLHPAINHNYEREHAFNLWFVVHAASAPELDAVILRIEHQARCAAIVLPLEEEFHIDLGFDLTAGKPRRARTPENGHVARFEGRAPCPVFEPNERKLIVALQSGIALVPDPFAVLGASTGLGEPGVLGCIERWLKAGLIRRFGVVVRHHELGFGANAMCVWDIADDRASALGRQLATEPAVTLCYRRRRAGAQWPYNLFCMIHGHERETVLDARRDIAERLGLDSAPHDVLFSCRQFKQTGARYFEASRPSYA